MYLIASAKYQGDIIKAEGREEQDAIALEKERQRLADEKRHADAFVDTIKGSVLLKNLKKRNEQQERRIEKLILTSQSGAISLKKQYETDISSLGDQIHNLGLHELEVREKEVDIFEESIEAAQKESQNKGVKTIEAFLSEKETIFDRLYDIADDLQDQDQQVTEFQREEVDRIIDTYRQKAKNSWNVVMSQELTLVSQTEQVLALFEKSLYTLIESFLSEVRALFQYGRNIDIRYFKRLTEIGERLESNNYEHMEAQRLTRESDSLLTLVANCHDGHQNLLLEEEQRLHDSVHEWAKEYLNAFRQKERDRNRTRVLELNHFLDSMKSEVEDLEIIPQNIQEDDL